MRAGESFYPPNIHPICPDCKQPIFPGDLVKARVRPPVHANCASPHDMPVEEVKHDS